MDPSKIEIRYIINNSAKCPVTLVVNCLKDKTRHINNSKQRIV
jgi:hypothetical protein